MLDCENNHVLSWMRKVAGAPTVVVAANFTAEPQMVNLVIPARRAKPRPYSRLQVRLIPSHLRRSSWDFWGFT